MPHTWTSRAGAAVIIVILFLAGLALLLEIMKRSTLFFPSRYPEGSWSFADLPIQPLDQWITAPDGVRLHALLFPAREPAAGITLIHFHGNGGNLTDRIDVATELAQRGISVLLTDYRGYGRSGGSPTEKLLAGDSVAVYDHVRSKLEVEASAIAVYGESLGGAYAAFVASKRPVRCAVIQSSFPSVMYLAQSILPLGPLAFSLRNSLTTAKWLNQARIPVLVFHGRHDEVIPYEAGVHLHESLRHPSKFVTIEGARHNDIMQVGGGALYDQIAEFVIQ